MLPIITILKGVRAETVGYNASNSILTVEICEHVAEGQSWIGVLAQEVFECRFKWQHLFLPVFVTKYKERMEILGHEIESVAAHLLDDKNLESYEEVEAATMASDHSSYHAKGLFKDMTEAEIVATMRASRAYAIQWVNDNRKFLERWKAKRDRFPVIT